MPKQERGAGRFRMEDVAREAGVSPATVSRVFNTPDLVLPETRRDVLAAARRLNYVRDLTAGSLAGRRSRIVGAIVPVVTTAIFSDALDGLGSVLAARGYQLLLGQSWYDPAREAALAETFLGRKVDGLVVTGRVPPGRMRDRLRRGGIPVVETWDLAGPAIDMAVGFSNKEAAAAAAAHLVARGHRRLGFVGGTDTRSAMRLSGFAAAAACAGLPPPAVVRFRSPTPNSIAAGAGALAALLEAGVQAAFCSNDMIAVGLLFECRRRGIDVPGALAVMGFSDLPIAAAVVPALTSVQVQARRIGTEAAGMLLDRIEGAAVPQPRLDLGFSIVVRDSA
jgi:LacI family gluconate utilization system Gnt-I transcriptional repressor